MDALPWLFAFPLTDVRRMKSQAAFASVMMLAGYASVEVSDPSASLFCLLRCTTSLVPSLRDRVEGLCLAVSRMKDQSRCVYYSYQHLTNLIAGR